MNKLIRSLPLMVIFLLSSCRINTSIEDNLTLTIDDFTMNQALGLYLIETIPKLDSEAPDYVANMLSLIEAILEDPTAVIRKQVDKIKTALVAQMKADGVDYDDRLEALEQV